MIGPEKFARLEPQARLRKLVRLLGQVELGLVRSPVESGNQLAQPHQPPATLQDDLHSLLALLPHAASAIPRATSAERSLGQLTSLLLQSDPCPQESLLRALNTLRHDVQQVVGQDCADWDFFYSPADAADGTDQPRSGAPSLPIDLYLDGVRSPFNVGSIMRSAAAFGIRSLLLSPGSPLPSHPRAVRSALGADLPWRVLDHAELLDYADENKLQLVLAESGGEPLNGFRFSEQGILVLGSEELGISPALLTAPRVRRLTIGLRGHKASLGVSVAAGIALHAWVQSLSVQ